MHLCVASLPFAVGGWISASLLKFLELGLKADTGLSVGQTVTTTIDTKRTYSGKDFVQPGWYYVPITVVERFALFYYALYVSAGGYDGDFMAEARIPKQFKIHRPRFIGP